MSDNTVPTPADDDSAVDYAAAALAEAEAAVNASGIAFPAAVDAPAKVNSAMARAAGRTFARDDYRSTAKYLFALRVRGQDVTARGEAFAAMFTADSDAHPVAGYPDFDAAKWTASFSA